MENIFDMQEWLNYFENMPLLATSVAIFLVVMVSSLANLIIKKVLLKSLERVFKFINFENNIDILRMIARLANIVPAVIIMVGVNVIPNIPDVSVIIVKNVCSAFIVVTISLAINALLDVVNDVYTKRPNSRNKPIKGYIQVVKLVVSVISAILVLSVLIDKSPLILLSGLGAMAAVMMLIFQDTILSLVAGVQISSNNTVKMGDWIEAPQLNADGAVIDIALHTIKVQNWDKTITAIPIRKLVTEPFKNWSGMQASGGRRIKRAFYIDQTSVRFLTKDEEKDLSKFTLLREYLDQKNKELEEWNSGLKDEDMVNTRKLTNIGTFRAYVEQYIKKHPKIKKDMLMIVRQLAPEATGIPMEVYCFTDTIFWVQYEGIQSDIFDHIFAIMPEFGLRGYQRPSGYDLRNFSL